MTDGGQRSTKDGDHELFMRGTKSWLVDENKVDDVSLVKKKLQAVVEGE